MRRFLKWLALCLFVAVAHSANGAASENRVALVIGNGAYRAKSLATSLNDAALIAKTLQASGFDVTDLANLNEATLRQRVGNFLAKVKNASPDAFVVVYFAGLGLQCEGENYLLPIDAEISQPADLALHALPLSTLTHSLTTLHVKASLVIIDAARGSPLQLSGQPPASGLAWMEPEPNTLVAFNATPGTVAPDGGGPNGAYAIALAEMIPQGGLGLQDQFDRVRLRVNELTDGAQVPWQAGDIKIGFGVLHGAARAPQKADSPERTEWMRSQPMSKLGPDDAYWVALLRDTFDGYTEFLSEHRNEPMAKRIQALLAARREAITWRRSVNANVPDAYWTYLERYRHGPHVADAQRLLTRLGAAIVPPIQFKRMDYDVPPPLPDELEFTERPALSFGDPALAFAPPKPPPADFLEAPQSELQALRQTAAASGKHALPTSSLLSSPGGERSPAAEPPGRLHQLAVSPAEQSERSQRSPVGDNSGQQGGQGRSLFASEATAVGGKAAGNSRLQASGPLPAARISTHEGPATPTAQSMPEDAGSSPGPSLPAWASLPPGQGRIRAPLSKPAIADPSATAEPLFVSAGLAPVAARRKAGRNSAASVHTGPESLARAPFEPPSQGSTQPGTTGSIAPAPGPSVTRAVVPTGRRARTLPVPAHPLARGRLPGPNTRQASQAPAGAPGRPSTTPGQGQGLPLPHSQAAKLMLPPANGPKSTAGVAAGAAAADQAAEDTAPVRKKKPAPPLTLAPNHEALSAVPARRSQKNPCTVSNGRLSCDELR